MTPDALVQSLERTLPGELLSHGVPGAAVGICDADRIVWSAGFGTTQRGGSTPVTTRTRFSVQSTSKLYTATAVLLAVRDALVDLDEPVTTYLPEFTVRSTFESDPASKITLRHLLNHTAGFTHEAPNGSNYDLGNGDFEAHCRSISDTWLRFPVGHHHEYSNLGIDLAGYILQRRSGGSFAEYVRRTLFEPLGLRRSTFDDKVIAADRDRATGHWRPFEEAGLPLPVKIPMVAAGGLYTSVDDALRYVQNHLRGGEDLLSGGLLREQYTGLGYGLGLYIDEWAPGVRVFHHGGSGFGFQAQLCWLPDLGFGAVVLTNYFNHDLQNILAHRIVEHLTGDRPGDVAGEYVGRLDDPVRVEVTDGRLNVRGTPMDGFRFLPDTNGRPRYLQDLRDGQVRYRNDAPPSTLAPGEAGTYVAAAWGVPVARYRVYQDGGSPVIQQDIALRLAPMGPGLYLSAMGEVLDLRSATPTYANIPLRKASDET